MTLDRIWMQLTRKSTKPTLSYVCTYQAPKERGVCPIVAIMCATGQITAGLLDKEFRGQKAQMIIFPHEFSGLTGSLFPSSEQFAIINRHVC